ncbi:MAG: molecular chaperone DnaK, partial [Actinobacteria bacterium]|nr:molecular chaperone DnaK [Actinomycetota bacterium]
ARIESALSEAKEALKGSDVQKIRDTVDNLVQASHKLAEAVYAQASAGGGAPGGETPGAEAGPDEEEVIDADFEVMDDDQA